MPKGQTSRPNNRKEKKAAATLSNLKTATKGFSPTNKKTVMGGKTATAARKTLEVRKTKETSRWYGKAIANPEGRGRTETSRNGVGYFQKRK